MLPMNPTDSEVRALWLELSNITVDEDDRIESPFYEYTAGEHIHNVWLWFDQFKPVNELLYNTVSEEL